MKETDGTSYTSKCVSDKLATSKRWYCAAMLELERVKKLPAGLGR